LAKHAFFCGTTAPKRLAAESGFPPRAGALGAAFAFELALAPALDFFEVFFDVFLDVFFAVFFAGRPDGPLAARFAALRAAGRGVRRRADFFDADFFFAFTGLFFVVFFLATAILLCRRPDHTIGFLSRRHEERVVITATPAGLEIRILPLAGRRAWRWRMALAAGAVAAAALAGSIRLAGAWENGLRRGEFVDLPLPILLLCSSANHMDLRLMAIVILRTGSACAARSGPLSAWRADRRT